MRDYDFCGWATRNDVRCMDGRTIRKDAFKDCDGKTVPLLWNHSHGDPINVLGHALLENRPEGVYVYGKFNDTEYGQHAKASVQNGDINALSICANQLKQEQGNVLHGAIREVSLVIAGANPKAYIEEVIQHGEELPDEAYIFMPLDLELNHADEGNKNKTEEGEKSMEENKTKTQQGNEDGETIQDIYNSMNQKQKDVCNYLVGKALEDAGVADDDDEGDGEEMKHNAFEGGNEYYGANDVFELSHSDEEQIIKMAKDRNYGSFQKALEDFADNNGLEHAALAGGFAQTGDEGTVDMLFPEYKDVRPGAPELITNDQGWIGTVINKVHKSPISRIRTQHADIRNIDALRAKGYKKGNQKSLTGNLKLVRRTTDPQTIYVKNALHRDDIIDITDFDYVQYLYNIDKMMLNEELAMAIMLGDGRDDGDENKIDPTHIRPIWTDDELYTIHVDLDIDKAKTELQGTNTGANFGDNYIYAEAMITTVLYAREKYRGSGTPDLYCTPHMLNIMLLARDINGRRIYSSKNELATALNVNSIQTVEQFEGKTRKTADNKTKKLIGIICNLNDYSLGATKGGEIHHFTQFDIDFNQEKSLIETRCSGALTKVYSAIAIEEPATESAGA